MRLARFWFWGWFTTVLGSLPVLTGCADTGVDAVQAWIEAQQMNPMRLAAAPVPALADTPPATYGSKAMDPFLPERVSENANSESDVRRSAVLFSDAPLSALSVAGYLAGPNDARVAMVKYGSQFRGVRIGDRISAQSAQVKQIDAQGILLVIDGATEQWLPTNKTKN
jgi:Tfp pilus assembly protein PilP